MNSIKMLSFAVVAIVALMAFVGESTASATVLCKTHPVTTETGKTCPEGWAYPKGTEIHAVTEGNFVLTTGSEFTEIICKKSTLGGATNNEGSATETVTASIEAKNLTWQECSTPNGACTTTTVKGGSLEIHWIKGTHNGTVTDNGVETTWSCASLFGTIHCIFVLATEHLGTITGGNPATIDIESTPINLLVTSSLCPSEPKWDAKYEITSPAPLYVANET